MQQALEERLCAVWTQISGSQSTQNASKTSLYEKFYLSNEIRCIDGTLICIVKPSCSHTAYFSRKGILRLNAMMICDHEMRIVALDACRPYFWHDSFIWNMSDEMHSEGDSVYP